MFGLKLNHVSKRSHRWLLLTNKGADAVRILLYDLHYGQVGVINIQRDMVLTGIQYTKTHTYIQYYMWQVGVINIQRDTVLTGIQYTKTHTYIQYYIWRVILSTMVWHMITHNLGVRGLSSYYRYVVMNKPSITFLISQTAICREEILDRQRMSHSVK